MVTEDEDRHCCSNSSGIQPWNGLTAVGYSLATSLAFLLVITFTSYFSTRGSNDADVDEAALMRHPKVVYSQAVKVTGSGGFCCIYINSTTNPPSEGMTGTGDPVHISFMIMLIIITYFCIEWTIMNLNSQFGLEAVAAPTNVEVGIDRATLMRYPKVTYSQANLEDKGTTATCCSICLSDFEDTDVLRLLPQCGHPFHLDCVDPWLRSHSSCPICRSFPEPRAEVVSSTWPTRSR